MLRETGNRTGIINNENSIKGVKEGVRVFKRRKANY